MAINYKTFFKRCGSIGFEVVLVLALVLIVALGGLALRLAASPLDIEFARPFIEGALNDSDTGVSIKAEQVLLHWPDLRGPLMLGLRGGRVYRENGGLIASVDEAALGLNKGKLLLGQFSPEALMLKSPSLTVIRHEDNRFDVGLEGVQEVYGPFRPEDQTSDDVVETVLAALSGEETGGALLSELQSFEVLQAKLFIDDRVIGQSWAVPRADVVFSRVQAGLKADLEIEFPSDVEDKPVLSADVVFNARSKALDITAGLQHFPLALVAEKMPGLEMLASEDVVLDVDFDAAYDPQARKISLPKAKVKLGAAEIDLGADLVMAEDGRSLNGPLRVSIDELAQADIAPLWPVALKGDNSEDWVVKNLSDGMLYNAYMQGDLVLAQSDEGWSGDVQKLVAGFEFDGMSVDYRAPLTPVKNAKGKGSFELDTQTLRIDIERASLLDMNITEAELEFINIIEKGAGTADINLALNGPLRSVLQYVADEPVGVTPDFDVANTQGTAELKVNIQFPTVDDIKTEDVKIDVRGTARDVQIPDVVQGLTLSGGPLNVVVKGNEFTVKGSGQLAGRPVALEYQEFLKASGEAYSSRVRAQISADPSLRERFGIDLSTFLEGAADVDVTYTSYQDGRSQADVRADLTTSRLFIDPFDYEKRPGAQASAFLAAHLQDGVLKMISGLQGTAPRFKLGKSSLSFRGAGDNTELASGRISHFALGQTAADMEFEITPRGLVKMVMSGSALDMRPFLDNEDEGDKAYENPPMQVSVAVDKMLTADGEQVRSGKLYADIDGQGKFNQLEMDGVAGAGAIYLRYKPDGSGKRVFRFEADDAGAALKAFDLYEGMRGGKMVVYGEPIRSVFDRNLIGRAEITNFTVVDAPGLARLLSAMSLPGLIQNMNGEGLQFSKMEADFDWLYRQRGSMLVLKEGRTSGNSLGLTFDGGFDNAAGTLDVSGTIIPLSGLNKMIGDIPLVGDILTGGTGALIAATYKMEGQAEDPQITVNPLAALAPGFLRRILFEEN